MLKFILLTTLIFFISCITKGHLKDIGKIFLNTSYDATVIENIGKYDTLKNIIIANIDTIFKFRNSRNIVDNYDENGKKTKIQQDMETYSFWCNFDKGHTIDQISLETLPAFIYPKIENICKELGKNYIVGFDLCILDSSLEIIIRNSYYEKSNAETQHKLVWNRIYSDIF